MAERSAPRTRVVIVGAAGRDFHNFIVVTKSDAAAPVDVELVERAARAVNPRAAVVRAASPVRLDSEAAGRGRRVLVVEDGPTTTHGGMAHGAGLVAARRAGAAEIVDPRPWAAREIAQVFERYPHLGPVLPAMGYTASQLKALEETLNAAPADVVVAATPIDLAALIRLDKPVVRARYEYAEAGEPGLAAHVGRFLDRIGAPPP